MEKNLDLFDYQEEMPSGPIDPEAAAKKALTAKLHEMADMYEVPIIDGKLKYGSPEAAAFILIAKHNAGLPKAEQINVEEYVQLAENLRKRFEVMKAHDEEVRKEKYLPQNKPDLKVVSSSPEVQQKTSSDEDDDPYGNSFEAKRALGGKRR